MDQREGGKGTKIKEIGKQAIKELTGTKSDHHRSQRGEFGYMGTHNLLIHNPVVCWLPKGGGQAGNSFDEGTNLEACWVTSPLDEMDQRSLI